MKSIIALVLALSLSGFSSAAIVYIEGINDTQTVNPNTTTDPMKEVVFLYTPSIDYFLSRLEFFTDGISEDAEGLGNGFTVRVREDINGAPGQILREVTYQLDATSSFQGADFASTLFVTAGKDYWVGFYGEDFTASHFALEGDLITEYGSATGIVGDWTFGPDAVFRPMMQFYGSPIPIPAAAWLFASSLLGIFGLRKLH